MNKETEKMRKAEEILGWGNPHEERFQEKTVTLYIKYCSQIKKDENQNLNMEHEGHFDLGKSHYVNTLRSNV